MELLLRLLLLSLLIKAITNITIYLKSLPYQCIGNSMGQFKFFKDLSVFLPTIQLCIGTPGDQCYNLGISLGRSGIIIENSSKEHHQFLHQYSSNYSSSYLKSNFSLQFHLDNQLVFGIIATEIVSFKDNKGNQYGQKHFTSYNSNSSLSFALLTSSQGDRKQQEIDGYIGLFTEYSPMKQRTIFESDYSLLNYLFNLTQISKRNIMLNYDKENPTIEFDGSYGNYFKCNKTIHSLNPYYWFCSPKAITLGNSTMNIDINDTVIFDSLKGIIIASSESGTFIHEKIIIFSKGKCGRKNDFDKAVLVCDKDTNISLFPDIYLTMIEGSMVFQWENLFSYKEECDCLYSLLTYLKFPLATTAWTIGIPGLITNKIIYDYDEMSIGFISNSKIQNKHSTSIVAINVIYKNLLIVCIFILLSGIVNLSITKSIQKKQ